jgi:hypothetical protein
MKNRWTWLAAMGLIVGSAAIGSVRAENDKATATLFTPRDRGDHFVCAAVNIGDKTLRSITLKIRGSDGVLLTPAVGSADTNPTSSLSVSPGTAAEIDINLAPPDDGYCEVAVSGTGNRNDVRVGLITSLTRTIPGTNPPVPVFVTRAVEGR